MKTLLKLYTVIFLLIPISYSYSQVGVNTNTPLGVFHIDAQGNTSSGTNFLDDIIIDNNGNIGLGTLSPLAKFDITGHLRLSDKSVTDLTDYILASDISGKASWKNYLIALRYKTIEWRVENTGWGQIDQTNKQFTFTGTSTLTTSEPGPTATSGVLTVPKGRYLIFMTGDIENINEYAQLRLMNNGTSILDANYIRSLSAAATYVEFNTTASLWLQFNVHDINSNASNAIPFLEDSFPFVSPNHIWVDVVLLGLDIAD